MTGRRAHGRRTGTGRRGLRYHRSVRFRSQGGGSWQFRNSLGTWEIERRRAEPGHPAGWYVFGPGTAGRRAGPAWEDAADAAVDLYYAALRRSAASKPDVVEDGR